MITIKRLLLSTVNAAALLVFTVYGARAEGSPATASPAKDMEDALQQLDALLPSQKEDGASDQLSEVEALHAKFRQVQADLDARLKALGDENQLLKSEVETQRSRADKAESERLQSKADFDRLFKDSELVAKADEQRAAQAQAREIERLKNELAAAETLRKALEEQARAAAATPAPAAGMDEAKARELTAAMEEMKEVDAQRKAAMDDLFKQLATQKKEMAARVAEVAAGSEALAQANALIAERDKALVEKDARITAQETALAARNADLEAGQTQLAESQKALNAKAGLVVERDVALKALQDEMTQVKLVDDQRRRTLDETLAALASAEQRAKTLTVDLEKARMEHGEAARVAADTIATLTARNTLLESEVARMEADLKVAADTGSATRAKEEELRAIVAERDRIGADLELQVSRLTAVDAQRRKAMDQILLDIATLDQEKAKLESEVKRLKTAEADASPAAEQVTALEASLEQSRRENTELRDKIALLETTPPPQGVPEPVVVDTPPAADAGVPAPVAQELSAWQQDKEKLEMQLRELREAAAQDAGRIAKLTQELEQAQQASLELTERVKALDGKKTDVRESDLYKELESINSMLREKMVEVEADRQRLSRVSEEATKLQEQQTLALEEQTRLRTTAETGLTEALAREAEYKDLIERLAPQVDALEQQVNALVKEREDLTNRLRERDADLQGLKEELERREHRLAKAERVAEVLEKARTEVLQAGDREKLNMHYNMASVYAREGKFAEAENEYLQALRIDPTDADVHYNLGILYDDEMKVPEKAAVHYRRYLQLSPHGPDADRVRNWLMKLEMRMQN